jgi:YD repeat-containing protein
LYPGSLIGYNSAGNLTKVTDAAGNVTTLAYDTNHNLTSITDARNLTTTVEYDTSDRVTKVNSPITIDGVVTTSTTSYAYDSTNLVTAVTDGEGRQIDYNYNPNKNVVKVTENPLESANQAITTFAYDNNNNLTEIKDPNANKSNGTGYIYYTYDDQNRGNLTGAKLPEGQQSYFDYDGLNNITRAQDFKGNQNFFDYDSKSNPIEATEPRHNTAANRYFSNGNLQYLKHPLSATENQISNSGFELDGNGDNWPDQWTQYTQSGTTATFAWSGTSSRYLVGPNKKELT